MGYSIEELFDMQETEVQDVTEQSYCVIDPETRLINVSDDFQQLGVVGDKKVERIYFKCPKIVGDNIDLSKLQLYVNFRNALGTDTPEAKDKYIVEDLKTVGEDVTFSWVLSKKVTAYKGTVNYIVVAVKEQDGNEENVWNTTLANGDVLEGLPVDEQEPTEEQSDVITQLLNIVKQTSESSVQAVKQAEQEAMERLSAIPVVSNYILSFGIKGEGD